LSHIQDGGVNRKTFIDKFKNKSDSELEVIISNSMGYIEEARRAAVALLKERDTNPQLVKAAELGLKELELKRNDRRVDEISKIENTVSRLNEIKLGKEKGWPLENGGELQILRKSQTRYQVRIEDNYMSFAAPLMICELTSEGGYRTWPMIYWMSVLKWGLGLSAIFMLLIFLGFDGWDNYMFALIPLGFNVIMQLITMPLMYRSILCEFKLVFGTHGGYKRRDGYTRS